MSGLYGSSVRSDRPLVSMNFLNFWHSIALTYSLIPRSIVSMYKNLNFSFVLFML